MTPRPLRCLALLLLLAASLSCNKQTAYGIPVEPASEPAAQKAAKIDAGAVRMKGARQLLSMVPARAAGVLLMDPRQVFSLMADLERTLGTTRDGRQMLAWAQALGDVAQVGVPWNIRQLERLGVDPTRPAMFFAVRREVVALPIKDLAALKARLSALTRRAPWRPWKVKRVDDLQIQVSGSYYRKWACHERDGYFFCARRAQQLVRALKRVPYRSQWVIMDRADKGALRAAAGYFFFSEDKVRVRGTARVMADGLKVRVSLSSSRLSRLAGPPPGEATLPGLAAGARSEFFARLPLGVLIGSMRGLSASLKRAGLDPQKLRAAFSGELLFVDRGAGNKALVLASSDRAMSRKLLDLMVKALPALPRRLHRLDLPAVKVTPVSAAEGGGYRLLVTSRARQVAFSWTLRLAAGKAGLIVGTEAAVKQLLERAPGKAGALSKAQAAAMGKGAVLALRSPMRDPDAMLPMKIAWDKAVGAMGLREPEVKTLIHTGRLLLDQLEGVSLGVMRRDAETLQLSARFTTLHRGQADDAARKLWLEAWRARSRGDGEAGKQLEARLSRRFPRSRYAARLKDAGGLDAGGGAAVTLLGAMALPAMVRRLYSSLTVEASDGLDKIKAGARLYFQADHYDSNGNLLPKRFPASTHTVPPAPPCGRTVSTPATVWDKAGWGKLQFAITDRHRYSYSFVSAGTNTRAVYTARALGDLDCDGKLSTFELRGSIDREFGVRVVGPIINNELE